ncbi:hypothetical protein A3J13_02335 [Candidatus Daviesbacteria bacterium RIFCSPLOWO2_02_FULL_36_8]|uniref:Clp R domain-containing protein n=1 Tax=Candidatus Daviesbacteria bacterium RIFCSPLOWO2_02_FULL_36_8 TaxID=1797793 RepID=A0A1F5MFE4_9BACT|nr:MAG: hypothetical protein A3J13_02335 [Candidatus Daviesbacteria bacterium RIFCSPLOWO2_02_FULL_36_8]
MTRKIQNEHSQFDFSNIEAYNPIMKSPELELSGVGGEILEGARLKATQLRHNYIGVEHILLSMIDHPTIGSAFAEAGVAEPVREKILFIVGEGEKESTWENGFTADAQRMIGIAQEIYERARLGHADAKYPAAMLFTAFLAFGEHGIASEVFRSVVTDIPDYNPSKLLGRIMNLESSLLQ